MTKHQATKGMRRPEVAALARQLRRQNPKLSDKEALTLAKHQATSLQMDATEFQPNYVPETHTCSTCDYKWRHGQDGSHSCAAQLRQQLDTLQSSPGCAGHTCPLTQGGLPIITTEMKGHFIGEFYWEEEAPYYDEDGELNEDHLARRVVPWDLCKQIYKEMTAFAAAQTEQVEDSNPEHSLFNEIRISTPVNEDGEETRYLINEQQLQRIRILEAKP